ncbi:MAG: zinc ABC transporter substrate-binding protein [Pseudomonadota bacterium]|nr:zinc ABC transporter substrate-binding protein [Pseudomonadota bacterium]
MLRNSLTLSLSSAALLTATTALADVPRVVTDIAPVHALVAQVMGDLGAPDLLVDPGSSPHSYAMRPSQARALEKADLVFWIGEPLTPWLEGPPGLACLFLFSNLDCNMCIHITYVFE